MPIQTSVITTIDAPIDRAFDIAASYAPHELIKAWGPLPGIVKTDGEAGPWSHIGQERRHHLSDNSSVREELTDFTRNYTYAYNLSEFTGTFKSLTRSARAEWHFTQLAINRTQIDWTYVFHPNGPLSEQALWVLVKTCWPGYLRSALSRVKAKAEAPFRDNAPSM